MTASLQILSWMALDAYDSRSQTNGPNSPTISDPDVETFFPSWSRQATDRADGLRNADASYNSGMEANVYVDEAAGAVVVAFRGTEYTRATEALADLDFQLVREANLDNDLLTLLGYYQDGGETLSDFFEGGGGLAAYLEDTFGLEEEETEFVDNLLEALEFFGLPSGVAALAREGEQDLKNQVETAVRTVMEVAAANPGKTITLTGHSLGGALAAAVAGALGLPAVLFDPAPYAAEGLLSHAREKAEAFLGGPYQALDTDALGWDLTVAPETHLADLTETYKFEGTFIEGLELTASPDRLPDGASTETEIDLGALNADAVFLHSIELLTLVIDSAELTAPGRPDFQSLSQALPSLVAQIDNGDLVSPADESVTSFLRTLLVSEPYYLFFAGLMERTIAEVADYTALAPIGSETRLADLERLLIDLSLNALGAQLAAGAQDAGGSVDAVFGNPFGSDGRDAIIGAWGIAETVRPGLGADIVALGGAAPDTVIGTFAELDDDTLFDFDQTDRLIFEDALFDASAIVIDPGLRRIDIDLEGDGNVEATLALRQSIDPESLVIAQEGTDTVLSFAVSTAGATEEEAEVVALLYEAGFGRAADTEGLNFWIDQLEAGIDQLELSEIFLESEEFEITIGTIEELTDEELVRGLYINILDREGEAEGVEYWLEALATENFDEDDLLLAFAISVENIEESPEVQRLIETAEGFWEFF
ncbi:MAG: DUF4214 domain-containing protein [Pikeienuella sp.]